MKLSNGVYLDCEICGIDVLLSGRTTWFQDLKRVDDGDWPDAPKEYHYADRRAFCSQHNDREEAQQIVVNSEEYDDENHYYTFTPRAGADQND